MKVFRTVVCAVIAALAATAMAEEAKPGPKFEFHGFIGGSLYAQDAVFAGGYGQQAINGVSKQPKQDRLVLGGDARQTRLNFSLAGPQVFGGAIPKGVAEIDFLSGLNAATGAAGTTGPIAVAPRLRLAYAELNWGATILRIGSENDLIGGSFGPTSVGHIPQSYAYGAGYLSSRHVDLEVFQTVPAGAMKAEFALQVMAPLGGSSDAFNGQLTTAEAGSIPSVEARARIIMPKVADAYVVGHWGKRDRNGQDNATGNIAALGDDQYVTAGSVGLKFTPGPLTFQGQGYVGKNLSEVTGGLGQTVPNNRGDAHEYGAWAQLGLNVTPEFSAWAFAGFERFTNFNDAIRVFTPAAAPAGFSSAAASVRVANITYAGMLRYMDGGYAVALEYFHMHTTMGAKNTLTPAANNGINDGNQLMLSGMYFF